MLEDLKKEVLRANLALPKYNLVTLEWGNVSAVDSERGLMVIKPSGVAYDDMTADDMVVVDLESAKRIEGEYRPSSDTSTHLELYREYPGIKSIVHTHSRWATVFAQCEMEIPPLGTTHADNFRGAIPCTRKMTTGELIGDYEKNTGSVIIETIKAKKLNAYEMPAVLVCSHGPFVWGGSLHEAIQNAVVLEEVAFMAWNTLMMAPNVKPITNALLDKHYYRKHGQGAYYGQQRRENN